MERLTKRDRGGNARMDCDKCEIRFRESCCSTKLCRNALIDRLAAYEDAEEQGLLIKFPKKVYEAVIIPGFYDVIEWDVVFVEYDFDENAIHKITARNKHSGEVWYSNSIGKTVFLTREEAEAALAKEG